jgi:pyridoxine kinase
VTLNSGAGSATMHAPPLQRRSGLRCLNRNENSSPESCSKPQMPDSPIISIQSEVVRGHVGNSAARFALQRLGLDVWSLPTVLLSHHPGHGRPEGRTTEAQELLALFDSLARRGWAGQVRGVITGYLGAAAQASAAASIVARVKALNPAALYLCDPVFGDDDGAYAKPGVAEAIARDLLPLADIAAPNRFELSSLSSQRVESPADAVRAARLLGLREVVVTSVPDGARIANIVVTPSQAWRCSVERETHLPHGTGDLLSALYLALRVGGHAPVDALAASVSRVQAVIRTSLGRDELQLVAAQDCLVHEKDTLPVEIVQAG